MEDERGGTEERKTDETKQGGEGVDRQAQARSRVGNTYKINLSRFLAECQYRSNFFPMLRVFWRVIEQYSLYNISKNAEHSPTDNAIRVVFLNAIQCNWCDVSNSSR